MQVILTHNITGVGYTGDVKNVKPGYFRNYLFPKGLAALATKDALKKYETMKEQTVKEKEELMAKAEETKAKLNGITLKFKEKVSEKGTLYGSITIDDILEALKTQAKMELTKDVVSIDGGSIKEAGEFTATVKLSEKHKAEVKIVVEATE
ncbi:MAG: 50S ribosomal protein L9 [Candidatus Peregrinibacteria bacterium]|nr:50S ribosomal protein L9 [Candidatus Peregrinibacteria bacterium]MDZ4245094.1 50S ribosomal protein L9 [Candidatus Gracilibacteria bacterium]